MSRNKLFINDVFSANSSSSVVYCSKDTGSIVLFITSTATSLLFLPLYCFALYLCFSQEKPSQSPSNTFMVHCFALHVLNQVGTTLYFYSGYAASEMLSKLGVFLMFVAFRGMSMFHILTCVERYLAVVKPVVYRGLRQNRGIRNVSALCVWLLSLFYQCMNLTHLRWLDSLFFFMSMALNIFVLIFCSVCVLCVLRRPGPGRANGRMDPTKKRAFYSIAVISGAMFTRFLGNLMLKMTDLEISLTFYGICPILVLFWLDLPSSSVLPLLLLQRMGKLPGCKQTKSK